MTRGSPRWETGRRRPAPGVDRAPAGGATHRWPGRGERGRAGSERGPPHSDGDDGQTRKQTPWSRAQQGKGRRGPARRLTSRAERPVRGRKMTQENKREPSGVRVSPFPPKAVSFPLPFLPRAPGLRPQTGLGSCLRSGVTVGSDARVCVNLKIKTTVAPSVTDPDPGAFWAPSLLRKRSGCCWLPAFHH